MAFTPRYPGVDITETAPLPHAIVPATTNLTAFLGQFPKGPTATAVLVSNWPEFTSVFGDLDASSSLAAYGVWQFFENGGIGAWIVRLVPSTSTVGTATIASPTSDGVLMTLTANGAGAWSASIAVSFAPSADSPTHVDFLVTQYSDSPPEHAARPLVLETVPHIALTHPDGTDLTAHDLAAVITNGSTYVRASADGSGSAASTPAPLNGSDGSYGDDWLAEAVKTELTSAMRLDQIAPAVFNLMCIPDIADWDTNLFDIVHGYCKQRDAFLIVDGPGPGTSVNSEAGMTAVVKWATTLQGAGNFAGAAYYPWVQVTDPVTQGPRFLPPSGAVAGVYATTDTTRGVWKAPAGEDAALRGVTDLADLIGDAAEGVLNEVGINCLRTFPVYGPVVWGARTFAGSDSAESPFKYVATRRLADFIGQSLSQSLRWAVFEPNEPALWSSVSLEVTAFMAGLFAQGAFSGASAAQAYQVVCDASTTSAADQLAGVVNVEVGFEPVDSPEFVMMNITIEAAASAS